MLVCLPVFYVYKLVPAAFCNYPERYPGVIRQNPSVADRCIVPEKVFQPHAVSPADCLFRYIVPSGLHPRLDPCDSEVRGVEPEVHEGYGIAFILGLFVASPAIFYQIWAFISPGLYEEEKHFIMPVAFISAIFFILGGVFCYYIVFHYAFQFFMSFVTAEIQAMPKISDYLDFVLKLILAFGFIFEMPIFAFFLSRMGIVTAAKMRRARRYAVLIIFIVAAILTPPDVVSQLLMAVPMLILYEISILVAALFGKKEAPKPEEEDEDDYEEDEYEDEDADDYDEDDVNETARDKGKAQAAATIAANTAQEKDKSDTKPSDKSLAKASEGDA